MKRIVLLILVACVVALNGCTANQRARRFGGTTKVDVAVDQQFVNITWKEKSLWILTTDREPGHVPRTYRFVEDSAFGALEGEVIITEK